MVLSHGSGPSRLFVTAGVDEYLQPEQNLNILSAEPTQGSNISACNVGVTLQTSAGQGGRRVVEN